MAKILTPTNPNEALLLPVSELKHVNDLFPGLLPEHASRAVDLETVLKYAQEDLEKFPALKVVETDEGLGVIDGNHRWNAYLTRAKLQALGLYDAEVKAQKEALKHKLSPEAQAVYDKALEGLEVYVIAEDYQTVSNVAKACLTANLENGLPPANKARVVMALEYWLIVRMEENPPSQASVARKFGITPPTLNEYVKKHDAEAQVTEEGAEGEAEGQAEKEQAEAHEKAMKRLASFKKFVTDLKGENTELYLEVIASLFPVCFEGLWLQQDTLKTVQSQADYLQKAMEIGSLDGSSMAHVKNLHNGLGHMLQQNEDAKAKKSTAKKAPASKKAPAKKSTQEDKSEGLFTGPHGEKDHNYMDNYLA